MNQACLIYPGIRIKTARDLDAKCAITVPGHHIYNGRRDKALCVWRGA